MTPYLTFIKSLKPGDKIRIKNLYGQIIGPFEFVKFEKGHLVVKHNSPKGVWKGPYFKFNVGYVTILNDKGE